VESSTLLLYCRVIHSSAQSRACREITIEAKTRKATIVIKTPPATQNPIFHRDDILVPQFPFYFFDAGETGNIRLNRLKRFTFEFTSICLWTISMTFLRN